MKIVTFSCNNCNTEVTYEKAPRGAARKFCSAACKSHYHYAKSPKRREEVDQWKLDNPERYKYYCQKSRAKRRGIEWCLTFEEWMEFWGDDFEKRGKGADDLVMSRFGDEGPYAIGNIFKQTFSENVREGNTNS